MFRTLLGISVLLATATSASAQVRTPAELFPPSLDFYVETAEPKIVVEIIEKVTRGTPWEDALATLHDRLDGKGTDEDGLWKGDPLPELTILTSPDARNELRKLGGFGFGYLGMNEYKEARYAGVLLTGECKLAELAMRVWLSMAEGGWRRVAVGEKGTNFYQYRTPDPNFRQPNGRGETKAWTPGRREPTLACVPGLIVVASDVSAATDVLKRFRGTDASPSLASAADYKARKSARPAAAIASLSMKPAKLLADHAAMRKADAKVPGAMFAAYLRFLVGVERLPEFHAHLTMTKDALELVGDGPLGVSPLRTLLMQPAAEQAWGEGLPTDAPIRTTFRVPTGPTNRVAIGALLDAVARSQGRVGKSPSLLLADWEREKPWAVLNEIDGVGFAVSTDGSPAFHLHLGAKRPLPERSAEVAAILKQIFGAAASIGREDDAKQHVFTLTGKTRLKVAASVETIVIQFDPQPLREGEVVNADDRKPFTTTGPGVVGTLSLHQLLEYRKTIFLDETPMPNRTSGVPVPPQNNGPDNYMPIVLTLRDVLPALEYRAAISGERLQVRWTIPNWHAALLRFFEAQTAKDDADEANPQPKAKEVPADAKQPIAPPPPPG